MNNPIDVRWQLQGEDVVLQCVLVGAYHQGSCVQPSEHPVLEIVEGEYATGKPLSSDDYDRLYEDIDLYAYVENHTYTFHDQMADDWIEEHRFD